MKDRLEIGPTPADESCEQVGTSDYNPLRAIKECQIFARQIIREFGPPPKGARVYVYTSNNLDPYREVAVEFDDQFPDSVEYAFKVEGEVSQKWDAESLEELRRL